MSAVIIFRLTVLNLLLFRFLNIFKKMDLYYLDISKNYYDMDKIRYIEKYNIKWMKREYKKFIDYNRSQQLAVEYAEIIYRKAKGSFTNRCANKLLNADENYNNKIEVVWKYYLNRAINPVAEQVTAAEFLLNLKRYKNITVICFNSFAYFLRNEIKNGGFKIVVFPKFYLYKGISVLLRAMLNSLKRPIKKIFIRNRSTEVITPSHKRINLEWIDYNKFEVVYFPHQGIYYGEMFKKDHYYSEESGSPLNKSKILHLSLGENIDEYLLASYKFYQDNDIPYADLYELPYNKKDLLRSLLSLIKSINYRIIPDLYNVGLWYIFFIISIYLRIMKYFYILSKFRNLKIALVGYDWLFPRPLSLALTMLKIKICANEERLIIAFFPDNYLILDYYFVASTIVAEPCMKTSQVDHFIPIGLVRVDNIFNYANRKNRNNNKYDTIKKDMKLIMALDFYMPPNELVDTTRPVAKISETRQFYNDLILLAREFPELHIVIKGKDAPSYKSAFIKDIIDEISGIKNMSIEVDYTKYDPYFMGEKADLTIACHTSLCDELLAAGRKVIIYEITDRLDTLFNYNKLPIIVNNYESLRYHVRNFINGIYLDDDTIGRISKEFYSDCYHGNVAKNIRLELEKIIENR